MTTPYGFPPDGAFVVGDSYGTDVTEDSVRAFTRGTVLTPWSRAQNGHAENTAGMYREVTRLDNRIDELVIGGRKVLAYTYSESDVWNRPKGAVRLDVNVLAGSSGGGREDVTVNGGGRSGTSGGGGFSGGWQRATIVGESIPESVVVTVGAGGAGATVQGAHGDPGGDSSFGDLVVATGATETNYGSGNVPFRTKGGNGEYGNYFLGWNVPPTPGGSGSFHPGGEAGAPTMSGNPGVNGHSITEVGQIGMGSSGGGGAGNPAGGSGGKGGDGGWPCGAGGGGGAALGPGGKGAGGMVVVYVYVEDTYGIAPSTPTGLTASNITSSSAKLTWTASTDDVLVGRYEVVVNGFVQGDTMGIDFELTGLSPSTAYEVAVRAIDVGGNRSDDSAPITVTTTA